MQNHDFKMKMWEFDTKESMLNLLIGKSFGNDPAKRMEEIRIAKIERATSIFTLLELNSDAVVIEIGSGSGVMANWMAPKVKYLHCCDISKSFLEVAREECQNSDNVFFHLVQTRKLDFAGEGTIDAVFSNNVFIHLNLYDIFIYFREFQRIVKTGGKVWFDITNSDILADKIPEYFYEMLGYYETNSLFAMSSLLRFNSPVAIVGIARHFGFKQISATGTDNLSLLFIKDASP